MAEDLELDLNEDNSEELTRKDSRIKSLSDKVKTTSEERDTLAKEKADALAKADAAQKDADFFKSFNQVSTKYAGSSEYQDKIREKAALGLDVEEATMLVMAKEGKYVPSTPVIEKEGAAGGSASTAMKGGESKEPERMTQAERLAGLNELEARGELKL